LNKKFDKILGNAIDESLLVLGAPAKTILIFHIESRFSLKFEDIPKHPELFVLAIKSILGHGSVIVESMIIQKLCSICAINLEDTNNTAFLESLSKIRSEVIKRGFK
jgi:hypothetical protein